MTISRPADGARSAPVLTQDEEQASPAVRTSGKPQYALIRDYIIDQIHAGAFAADERIPSEHKLARQFGVSRLTVQRALRELVGTGILRRSQGSGTFVNPTTPRFSLIEVRDLADQIKESGGTPGTDLLVQRRLLADARLAEQFCIAEGEEIFHAALVQSMNDIPVALEERFALPAVFPDFLEQDFLSISVFDYFASRTRLEEIENVVSAIIPERRVCNLLEIERDEPALFLERRNIVDERPITVTRITYAGSRQVLASRYKPFG